MTSSTVLNDRTHTAPENPRRTPRTITGTPPEGRYNSAIRHPSWIAMPATIGALRLRIASDHLTTTRLPTASPIHGSDPLTTPNDSHVPNRAAAWRDAIQTCGTIATLKMSRTTEPKKST